MTDNVCPKCGHSVDEHVKMPYEDLFCFECIRNSVSPICDYSPREIDMLNEIERLRAALDKIITYRVGGDGLTWGQHVLKMQSIARSAREERWKDETKNY